MENGLNGFLRYVLSDVLWRKTNLSPEDGRDELKAVYIKGRDSDLTSSVWRALKSHTDLDGLTILSVSADFVVPNGVSRNSYNFDVDALYKQFQKDLSERSIPRAS